MIHYNVQVAIQEIAEEVLDQYGKVKNKPTHRELVRVNTSYVNLDTAIEQAVKVLEIHQPPGKGLRS
jgi:hypothetical protein